MNIVYTVRFLNLKIGVDAVSLSQTIVLVIKISTVCEPCLSDFTIINSLKIMIIKF